MLDYPCVIAAIDLEGHSDLIISRALGLCTHPKKGLHLVHVTDHPVTGLGDLTGKNHRVNQMQIRQQIFPALQALSRPAQIPADNLHILFGDPGEEIHALAEKLACDLIVCGFHDKRGLAALLSRSTSSNLLSDCPCDLLAVHTQADK